MMQQKVTAAKMTIPRAQIRPPAPSLAAIAELHADRDEAIVATYATALTATDRSPSISACIW